MDGGRRRMDMGQQVRGGRLAGLAHMHHIAGPLGIPLVAIARIDIIGRLDTLGGWWQVPVRLETHAGHGPFLRRGARPDGPFVVPLPGPAERDKAGGLAHRLWGRGRLGGIEDTEPILPHGLGIRLARRLLAGQPGILDPLAIAFIPLQRRPRPQPLGGHGRQLVQGRA